MELSEDARAFVAGLDPEMLSVGDGSDGLPVWIAVDAQARRVYRVFANGVAEGFGDGVLQIYASRMGGVRVLEQLTMGSNMMLTEGAGEGRVITCCELSVPAYLATKAKS